MISLLSCAFPSSLWRGLDSAEERYLLRIPPSLCARQELKRLNVRVASGRVIYHLLDAVGYVPKTATETEMS